MAVTFTEVGKVLTGFSKPYIALYSATGGNVTYSNGQEAGRGVSASVEITTGDANNFYANNGVAESAPQKFTEGQITLTIDGLLNSTRKLMFGTPEAGADGWTGMGDNLSVPYLGYGHIVRYLSGGVESFVPVVYPKIRFQYPGEDASTQEDEIDWQTQELTADIFRKKKAEKKIVVKSEKSLCPVHGKCGGCQLLDMPYEKQLKQKQKPKQHSRNTWVLQYQNHHQEENKNNSVIHSRYTGEFMQVLFFFPV